MSFAQFDSERQGQLSYLDLERLLEKDATVEAREDCVKMVSTWCQCPSWVRVEHWVRVTR